MNIQNNINTTQCLLHAAEDHVKILKEKQNQLEEIKNNCNNTNESHKIMNEIIEILIKNNMTFYESTRILDGVRRRITTQIIGNDCLYK